MAPATPKQFCSACVRVHIRSKTKVSDTFKRLREHGKHNYEAGGFKCWAAAVYRCLPVTTRSPKKYQICVFVQGQEKYSEKEWIKLLGLDLQTKAQYSVQRCGDDNKREAKIRECCGQEQNEGQWLKSERFVCADLFGNLDKLKLSQLHLDAGNSNDELDHAICPITQVAMIDPVVTPYGDSFEKSAIENWLKENKTGENPYGFHVKRNHLQKLTLTVCGSQILFAREGHWSLPISNPIGRLKNSSRHSATKGVLQT